MEIRVGDRRWIVESRTRPLRTGDASGSFVDVTFESESGDERLELGWVPAPERFTPALARRLFELAGRRLWTDPRSGRRYEVDLVDGGSDEGVGGHLWISFAISGTRRSTAYPLARPLGLVTDTELEAMVDAADDPAPGGAWPPAARPAGEAAALG